MKEDELNFEENSEHKLERMEHRKVMDKGIEIPSNVKG